MIKNVHEMGHFQTEKTYDNIRVKYWWPIMLKEVNRFVENCELCQRQKMKIARQPLQELPLPVMPWELLGIDLVGPLTESYQGNKYIFTLIDHFSAWTEAFPIKDKEAQTIAKLFMEEIICRYSCPKKLLSDRGSEFCNSILKELTTLFNICKIKTSPYHPQSNGMIERVHRNLGEMLRAIVENNQELWDMYIPAINLAFNSAKSKATSFSPHILMFERPPRIELDVLTKSSSHEVEEDHHIGDILERQCKAFDLVQTQIKK